MSRIPHSDFFDLRTEKALWLRAADPSNCPRANEAKCFSPGEQSEAPRRRWKPGQEQHPGPQNQDSQHMLDQPRGSFPEIVHRGASDKCLCVLLCLLVISTPYACPLSRTDMTGRLGDQTMEMNAGRTALCLSRARSLPPLVYACSLRSGSKGAFRLPGPGATWDHFRCTVEPLSVHIRC